MSSTGAIVYNPFHSYFIGPKGSNMSDFRANINTILDELLEARLTYMPEDQVYIPPEVRRSKEFSKVRINFHEAVRAMAQLLGEHSVPFWSPRYQAHMCMDLTMPSMLGYFMTMLYNPNNVVLEVSPLTTQVELRVGEQLCDLFGYNRKDPKLPIGWGHVTCDGTVANLESVWVARNLKFYPIALHRAVREGQLNFIANHFKVKTCREGSIEKLFNELDTWELLNLRPETVLDLPLKLNEEFGISSQFLEKVLKEYSIQTVGRGSLEEYITRIDLIKNPGKKPIKPIQYFVAKTRHYSWPKTMAITGLGSGNITEIDVDINARIDMNILERKLLECVHNEQAVYAVVAIVGSTEEGAVDRLSHILKLREKFQNEHGLSFLVYADAAWGGYFASMLDRRIPVSISTQGAETPFYLREETKEDLWALEKTDSITVDPHKSGYIPYPAGGLVYRDGRMRHLVTWSSPYLSQGSSENIGIYGVEGRAASSEATSSPIASDGVFAP